jgi:hypothetical protein
MRRPRKHFADIVADPRQQWTLFGLVLLTAGVGCVSGSGPSEVPFWLGVATILIAVLYLAAASMGGSPAPRRRHVER